MLKKNGKSQPVFGGGYNILDMFSFLVLHSELAIPCSLK